MSHAYLVFWSTPASQTHHRQVYHIGNLGPIYILSVTRNTEIVSLQFLLFSWKRQGGNGNGTGKEAETNTVKKNELETIMKR